LKSTNIKNFSSKGNDDDDVIHERIASGSKNKFECACGKVYDIYNSLICHILNKNNSFPCPHCSKVLLTRTGLRQHLDNQVCTKDISDDDDDDDNDNDNDDEKVNGLSCQHCDKIFKSDGGLKYHLSHRVCYDDEDEEDDDDGDDDDSDEDREDNDDRNKHSGSSRRSPSRPPPPPSNAKGTVTIISL